MLRVGAVPDDATFEVRSQDFDAERIERGAGGGDLVENIEAIALFIDHFADTGDLSADAIDAGARFFAVIFVHNWGQTRRARTQLDAQKWQGFPLRADK